MKRGQYNKSHPNHFDFGASLRKPFGESSFNRIIRQYKKSAKYRELIFKLSKKKCKELFDGWCSRKNQIVIDYPEDKLVLLAIRHNNTGEYVSYENIKNMAAGFKIPVVESYVNTTKDLAASVALVKELKDKEGYVMVWPDGHRMKAKADWYVTLHRAKEAIGREKDLIKAYLTTGVDDILPILPENYKREAAAFLAKLTEELVNSCRRLDGIFVNLITPLPETFTRKDFAIQVLKLHPRYKSIMFNLLPGTPCMEVVIPYLIKACSNKKTLDEWRWLIGGIRFDDKIGEVG